MSAVLTHLGARRRARLLRTFVAAGPFGLPVAVRIAPFSDARARPVRVTALNGTMVTTAGADTWICNASAAVLALATEDHATLQAAVEALYGTPIDPALVDVGRTRLAAIGLVPPSTAPGRE